MDYQHSFRWEAQADFLNEHSNMISNENVFTSQLGFQILI